MPFDPEPMVERMGGGRGSRGLRPEIRRVINSTNTIESLSTSEGNKSQRPLPHLTGRDERRYPVVRSLDPKGTGQERWMNRWKPALNAFAITFEGRLF